MNAPMVWPATAHGAPLVQDEVHVWLADLGNGTECLERFTPVLSEDERERAARFHFRRDAIRWAMSRVVLRSILGRYLCVEPRAVRFQSGPRGKPELAMLEEEHIQFNASHSDGLGLYAVARTRRVGVDIERVRPLPDFEPIARRMFSPHEQRVLGALPRAEWPAAFFDCWTRKEAYIKAIGDGPAYPLERFSVSLSPDAPAKLEDVQDDPAEAGRWSLAALAAAPGYAAAMAIEGPLPRLLCAQWQERAR
jgi:4'-phosphopantetheinyl transferase